MGALSGRRSRSSGDGSSPGGGRGVLVGADLVHLGTQEPNHGPMRRGEMAEGLKASVLKTDSPKGLAGSNPALPAISPHARVRSRQGRGIWHAPFEPRVSIRWSPNPSSYAVLHLPQHMSVATSGRHGGSVPHSASSTAGGGQRLFPDIGPGRSMWRAICASSGIVRVSPSRVNPNGCQTARYRLPYRIR